MVLRLERGFTLIENSISLMLLVTLCLVLLHTSSVVEAFKYNSEQKLDQLWQRQVLSTGKIDPIELSSPSIQHITQSRACYADLDGDGQSDSWQPEAKLAPGNTYITCKTEVEIVWNNQVTDRYVMLKDAE